MSKPNLLTTKEAADYIHVAPETLSVWRSTGRHNLPYIKIGKYVKYDEKDLLAFIEQRKFNRTEVE